MNVRTDIVKMYKEIHGWVGIISGLGLFIAFFAGALTMFDGPIKRWASAPTSLPAPVSLERTPELIEKVLASHPQAAKGYTIHLDTDGTATPARLEWQEGPRDHGTPPKKFHAGLDESGALQVVQDETSPVSYFIDVLHQQIGIMLDHELAMPIMGGVALLYFIALVSGTIVLLPSLVKDLYALRIGKNAKRMWLDLHNMLGIFSLPFHIIMAVTSVTFAFHDQFYDAQRATFVNFPDRPAATSAKPTEGPRLTLVSPAQAVASLKRELPGFTPSGLTYGIGRDGSASLRVMGSDPRYGMRGPTYTLAMLDPQTGAVTGADYLGGKQDGWGAALNSFFALHFGSFGGTPIRWAYFLLGLSGAAIFYTGNLLWIESRRRRERKAGLPTQTRATRVLGALTVGVPLGCIAGIGLTMAAAKPLGLGASLDLHSLIYHVTFFAFVAWALVRGSARGAIELLPGAALACLAIPAMTLATLISHPPRVVLLDAVALAMAMGLVWAWRATIRRARNGPRDSVWSATIEPAMAQANAQPAE